MDPVTKYVDVRRTVQGRRGRTVQLDEDLVLHSGLPVRGGKAAGERAWRTT